MGKRASQKKEIERFTPGMESDDQFDKVLSLLSEWIKAGIVKVDVDADGTVDFELPRELEDLLGTQIPEGLAYQNVARIIDFEIPTLVSAGFVERPNSWLQMRLPDDLSERIDTMLARSQKAVDKLVNQKLKERILLRRTAPVYVVNEMRPTMGTYHVEMPKDSKMDVRHVLLDIGFVRPHSGQTLAFGTRSGLTGFARPVWRDEINVQVALHRDDIANLIEELRRIYDQLP